MKRMKIEENTIASVHYTGTLPESGEMFDSSEGREPLTFLVGHGQMIPGFEAAMIGAKLGTRRHLHFLQKRHMGRETMQLFYKYLDPSLLN